MNNQADSEDSVKDGVVGAAGNECCSGHGNQGGRQQTFKCPVVRAVGARGGRECGRIVDGALVDCCKPSSSVHAAPVGV